MARIPLFPRRDACLERRDAGLEAGAVDPRHVRPVLGDERSDRERLHHATVSERAACRTTCTVDCPYAPAVDVVRPSADRLDDALAVLQASEIAVYGDTRTGRRTSSGRSGTGSTSSGTPGSSTIDGRVAGVAHLLEQKGGRFLGDAYVHPELTGRGVGTRLLESLEERVRELRPEWPDGERIVLEAAHLVGDERAPGALRRPGLRVRAELLPHGHRRHRAAARSRLAGRRRAATARAGPRRADALRSGDRGIRGGVGLRHARLRRVAQAGVRPERLRLLVSRPSSGRETRSSRSRGTTRSVMATGVSSGRSASGRRGEARARPRAAPRLVPAASARPERRRSPSVSTSTTRPARRVSTSARACTSSGRRTSGRRSSVPPAELAVRAPTPRDAAGIAELLNAHAAATGRPGDETGERVERWFELEDLDPARDMFLAVEGGKDRGLRGRQCPRRGARRRQRRPSRPARAAGASSNDSSRK